LHYKISDVRGEFDEPVEIHTSIDSDSSEIDGRMCISKICELGYEGTHLPVLESRIEFKIHMMI
jgi:hypothetical protein